MNDEAAETVFPLPLWAVILILAFCWPTLAFAEKLNPMQCQVLAQHMSYAARSKEVGALPELEKQRAVKELTDASVDKWVIDEVLEAIDFVYANDGSSDELGQQVLNKCLKDFSMVES